MLEYIFGSKTRVKLLRFILTNNFDSCSLEEIRKKTGLGSEAVKKELGNLKKINLLSEKKIKIEREESAKIEKEGVKIKKNKTVKPRARLENRYLVNKNFVLYTELRALLVKSQLLLEEFLLKKLKKLGKVYYLVLSGFFTGAVSKTDLLIVGRINRKKIRYLIKKVEKDLGREINYTLMSLQEFKFRSNLTDRFLFDILENKKVVLIDEL